MDSLILQVISFMVTILIGALLGMILDLYRVIRGITSPTPITTTIGDILFWIIATAVSFYLLLKATWADMRFYVFLGFLVGFNIYRALMSRLIINMFLGIYDAGRLASHRTKNMRYKASDLARVYILEGVGGRLSRLAGRLRRRPPASH